MKLPIKIAKNFSLACDSDATVLLTGQTGTGKSTLAKLIHQRGKRRTNPFISINLATLHDGVLESELFGHERGSFTGADRSRIGKLELAQGGTVFLDEIGEMTFPMQAKLLEFLQSKRISPVGSNREVQLDVRVIAATHKDLHEAVRLRTFREDLFHRLRVLSIELQPLHERIEELDDLIHECLQEITGRHKKTILRISPWVAEKFESYVWPGNLRELSNVLEYAVLSAKAGEIQLEDLPSWFVNKEEESFSILAANSIALSKEAEFLEANSASVSEAVFGTATIGLSEDYRETLAQFEKEYLSRVLRKNCGKISRSAKQIGISKATLLRRIHAYSILSL